MLPVPPVTALAGALTVMLPADVDPSDQLNKVKLVAEPPVAKPITRTV